jgi:quercetin dioxygenase-like cupin family protein
MRSDPFAVSKAFAISPDSLKWIDVPLVQGAQAAILFGDPTKTGTVVMRFKFPAHRKTPLHKHPYAEVVTIISGRIGYGEGEESDTAKGKLDGAGTFAIVPAQQAHFVWTEDEEAIVQLQFEGPAGVTYVNPADDPRIASHPR